MESSQQSYILPARRAQWLVSALSYAYGLGQPMQNEVVVLATGLDQYLQELFHHLDFDSRECISGENFRILMDVLGLRKSQDVFQNGMADLGFKEFHRKLVQCFIEEKDKDGRSEGKRWCCDGEFVEAEVHLVPREGHSVRTMCTECFRKKPVTEIFHSVLYKQGKCTSADDTVELEYKGNFSPGGSARSKVEKRSKSAEIFRLQEENEGLRELVEDMRQALQSSDAKNLALEVTVRNLRSNKSSSLKPFESCFTGSTAIKAPQYLSVLTRELNRLQDGRNIQIEEAIRYTQELEADLWRSRKDQETLAKARVSLLQNQKSVTDQLEKARQVLRTGLERVKILESQTIKIEEMQRRLKDTGTTMTEDKRSCRQRCYSPNRGDTEERSTCMAPKKRINEFNKSMVCSERTSPTGSSGSLSLEERASSGPGDGEQMIRAVEGQEASDDDTGWQEEGNNNSPSCSESGSDTVRRAKVSEIQAKLDRMRRQLHEAVKEKDDMKSKLEQEKSNFFTQFELKTNENDYLQREVQHLETERVRLSLVEATMTEIITLLRKLKELHLSRRSVGKIVMDTLEICLHDNTNSIDSEGDVTEGDVKRFLSCLHKQLKHHDLLLDSKVSYSESSHHSPTKSYVSHKALQLSQKKNSMALLEQVSESAYSRHSSSSSSSVQVKTNFYQFGGMKSGTKCHLSAFKAIKTEMGTV